MTPGRLSDASPRSAARSGYCSGRTPVTIASRAGSSSGEASTPPLRIRSILVCSLISEKRVAVGRRHDGPRAHRGRLDGDAGENVVGLEPRRDDDHDAEVPEHLDGEVELRLERLGLRGPLGLVDRPPLLAAAVAAVVEADHDDVGGDPVDGGDQLGQQPADRPRRSAVEANPLRADAWNARCSSELPSTASTVG